MNKYLLTLLFIPFFWILTSSELFAQTGTLLFREDFKGNLATDPIQAPTDLSGGYSDFLYGQYKLVKFVNDGGSGVWWQTTANDHTNWGDATKGYYMFVDPPHGTKNKILYQKRIDGLCDDVEVLLSAWIIDVCVGGLGNVGPVFKLRVSNATTNAIIMETGDLTVPQWNNAADVKWTQFTLSVPVPVGVNSINFAVINREDESFGNDLGLDDIEIYLVTNDVITSANGNTSANISLIDDIQTIFFKGSYINDGTFGTNLSSYWIYSTTGDITSFTDWVPLNTKSGIYTIGDTCNHDFTLMNAKPGYYRLVIGRENQVLSSVCRAASQVIHVQ